MSGRIGNSGILIAQRLRDEVILGGATTKAEQGCQNQATK
jgi:hypothetical protein